MQSLVPDSIPSLIFVMDGRFLISLIPVGSTTGTKTYKLLLVDVIFRSVLMPIPILLVPDGRY